jgi:UDP-N-acetylmuramoylalanine--D-glutamate ligase
MARTAMDRPQLARHGSLEAQPGAAATFSGQRVTVMGLGRHGGGAGVARWLARQGAIVTVTDLAGHQELRESLAVLHGEAIAAWHLGGHQEADFRGTDVVVVNPCVAPDNPLLKLAAERGARLTSEIEIFLSRCRGQVVGVTGTTGKSTTATMLAQIICCDRGRSFLGGNIGGSLLDRLAEITPRDWVVVELSSFQLQHLQPQARWPEAAIVTNCRPNHLDWHGKFEAYRRAKQRLITNGRGRWCVLNPHDAEVWSWRDLWRGPLAPLPDDADLPALQVPGDHNRGNAACAAAAALGIGCSWEAVRQGLAEFAGLPHRLALVGQCQGRRFYNDSKATTPDAAAAALNAFDAPVWLLAGGKDKGCDFAPLWSALARRARGAAFFGSMGPRLAAEAYQAAPHADCFVGRTLGEALAWCWRRSAPGDVIVLSPACASFDQYRDYSERGREFEDLAERIAAGTWPAGSVG